VEKSANYFIVGLFVSLALTVLIGFLVWLEAPHDNKNLSFYTVEFTDSISGLSEGADVEYKGVQVGKVMKTYLVPGNNNLVRADIGVNKMTPVHAHTKVILQEQGITGLVRLEMSTATDDLTAPERRSNTPYPVLAGQGSHLYKALEDLPAITAQVAEISRKIDAIITRNRGSIERFSSEGLSGVTSASQEIRGAAASVRKLSDKLDRNPSQIIFPPSSAGVEIPP
jgi:phospholipid/cholesterol/gamma-HCH transport system substrate-binding protein